VEVVLSQLPRHTRHVPWRPCEDVPILTEEAGELAFLFAAQAGTDGDVLVRLGRVEQDLLGVVGRLEVSRPSRAGFCIGCLR
jgi:hypothetical protein